MNGFGYQMNAALELICRPAQTSIPAGALPLRTTAQLDQANLRERERFYIQVIDMPLFIKITRRTRKALPHSRATFFPPRCCATW